jgi:hypothetical protein
MNVFQFSSKYALWISFSAIIFTFSYANEENNNEDEVDPVIVLLFMFFGLGVGVLLSQVLSIFGEAVPYTVLVFLLGMLFSTAADSNGMCCLLFVSEL